MRTWHLPALLAVLGALGFALGSGAASSLWPRPSQIGVTVIVSPKQRAEFWALVYATPAIFVTSRNLTRNNTQAICEPRYDVWSCVVQRGTTTRYIWERQPK